MTAALPIPAAQYLRMSTDQQRLSLAYQSAAIRRYAEAHGFKIVKLRGQRKERFDAKTQGRTGQIAARRGQR